MDTLIEKYPVFGQHNILSDVKGVTIVAGSSEFVVLEGRDQRASLW